MKFFKKRKYEVKYILYFTITWKEETDIEETITYLLLENEFSDRRIEIRSYGYCETFEKERTTELYLKVILPWLKNIDGPLKDHMEDYPDNVVENDKKASVTVTQDGNIFSIKRDE